MMNIGSKIVVGLLFILGMLQLMHVLGTFSEFGHVDWLKVSSGLVCFIISISGFYWIKRNPHRS
ncbi:hypothetical protein GCM10028816_54150 [Spirosoma lituiforme]